MVWNVRSLWSPEIQKSWRSNPKCIYDIPLHIKSISQIIIKNQKYLYSFVTRCLIQSVNDLSQAVSSCLKIKLQISFNTFNFLPHINKISENFNSTSLNPIFYEIHFFSLSSFGARLNWILSLFIYFWKQTDWTDFPKYCAVWWCTLKENAIL